MQFTGQLALHVTQVLLPQPGVSLRCRPDRATHTLSGLQGTFLVRTQQCGVTRHQYGDLPSGLTGLTVASPGQGDLHRLSLDAVLQVPGGLAVAYQDDSSHCRSLTPHDECHGEVVTPDHGRNHAWWGVMEA